MVSKIPVYKTDPTASWLSARALLQSDQLHSSLLLKPKEEVTLAAETSVILSYLISSQTTRLSCLSCWVLSGHVFF